MGGIPCEIIINCGALKSTAANLYEHPSDLLRPLAAELAALEDEICELGPELAPFLSAEERIAVHERAAAAWSFRARLAEFIAEWPTKPGAGGNHYKELTVGQAGGLAMELRTFIDEQAQFFHDLVDKYRDAG